LPFPITSFSVIGLRVQE